MNEVKKIKAKVISNKMQNTCVVQISRLVKHAKYKKYYKKTTKLFAHTDNEVDMGQEVYIKQCRPISKNKSWMVCE